MTNLVFICTLVSFHFLTCKANLNIAFGKPARQSTTFTGPELAVNGEFFEWKNGFQCAHTYTSPYAWWAVDLGDVFTVSNILVYGRTDCCSPSTVMYKACGYIGQSYNGSLIEKNVSRSKLDCVTSCLQTDTCCAAEYSTKTQECTLDTKADNLEDTTNSLVNDPTKITFLV